MMSCHCESFSSPFARPFFPLSLIALVSAFVARFVFYFPFQPFSDSHSLLLFHFLLFSLPLLPFLSMLPPFALLRFFSSLALHLFLSSITSPLLAFSSPSLWWSFSLPSLTLVVPCMPFSSSSSFVSWHAFSILFLFSLHILVLSSLCRSFSPSLEKRQHRQHESHNNRRYESHNNCLRESPPGSTELTPSLSS